LEKSLQLSENFFSDGPEIKLGVHENEPGEKETSTQGMDPVFECGS
jgi:hypothetical protein